MIEEVKRLQNCEISSFNIENNELKKLMNNYNIFKQQCLNGEHGKTSQFYLIYISLIHHYLNLSRSIRTGDFEFLYQHCLKLQIYFLYATNKIMHDGP